MNSPGTLWKITYLIRVDGDEGTMPANFLVTVTMEVPGTNEE